MGSCSDTDIDPFDLSLVPSCFVHTEAKEHVTMATPFILSVPSAVNREQHVNTQYLISYSPGPSNCCALFSWKLV